MSHTDVVLGICDAAEEAERGLMLIIAAPAVPEADYPGKVSIDHDRMAVVGQMKAGWARPLLQAWAEDRCRMYLVIENRDGSEVGLPVTAVRAI